ncbi:SurA N-terminal domain-containing protein [Siccirubricoccus sp. KC 17139]|uniref:Parvulin-like PPIase n=1 Tax=Siccirubricoccus soli TaxID=2899147 RepID=A0ABT1D0P0_9PROT|nr:SurA N-terminal domain-containing protein [Siccirubricoccus soli]MCO6415473.1 SurA N-terminal domain-containing protein [Siccirubricoccus soli]MCP2681605.1 SurA N-terminal domain-containing protein [Siccirubricoccus soli]
MLTALRRLAGTWFAKLLFLLLIASFAIWGVGDMVRNFGRDDSVARVNGSPIEIPEVQTAARREMQRLARQLGGQFENDPRIRRAVTEQAVDQLVLDRVLRAEAQRLHLAVPDEAVREFIFGIPGFRGLDGRFSRPVFESFLRSNDLSEPAFLALVRADLARQQVAQAVRAGAAAPDALAKPLLRWLAEQRAVTIVALNTADAPEPPAPEEAQLRRFHENNPERFSTPEMRTATVAVLTADLLSRQVEVTEQELEAAYEARHNQYEATEQRTLQQVVVPDEAKAKEIATSWAGGADFAAVTAEAQSAGGQAVELGTLSRDGLPLPELAEAAFAAPVGGVTAPVQSPFGWHVLRVEKIEAGRTRPLAEVRDALRRDLAQEKAADLAFERANKVEDALAGGATLEEVAQRFQLGFAKVTLDASGHDAEGKEVALPVIAAAREPLLRAIFTTERGAPPRLAETEAGFVAVTIQDVAAPALRPFESVEAEVRAAFLEDQKRRTQETRAAGLLQATKEGKSLADAAREAGLGFREVGALRRDQREGAGVPPELLAPIFELKPREATMVPTRTGFAVAQLTEVTQADPDADPALLARVRQEATQAVGNDLEVQFLAALRARADVRVNPRLVDQLAQP